MWWLWYYDGERWLTFEEPMLASDAAQAERLATAYSRQYGCPVRWRNMQAFLGDFDTFLEDDAKQGD